jgi:hypothetical protein
MVEHAKLLRVVLAPQEGREALMVLGSFSG